MDDFVLSNLQESRNEWCSRLVSILCPLVIEGVHSIFNEAWKMCIDQKEAAKYLMTFQNLLTRVPKWNSLIVEQERKRMIERSGCNYLEDLITCVHIIQLKVITCIRVGNRQKKIDISIPKLDHFIHKLYTHVARKVYMNIYLFEKNITQLQVQKNNRELELIVQECIMITIRESIPTEDIIRAYMDESVEHEEEVTIEQLNEPVVQAGSGGDSGTGTGTGGDVAGNSGESSASASASAATEESASGGSTATAQQLPPSGATADADRPPAVVPSIQNVTDENVTTRLTFNDFDSVLDLGTDQQTEVSAPKTLERLEEISAANALQRKLDEEEADAEDDGGRIRIHRDNMIEPGDLAATGGILSMDSTTPIILDIDDLEI